MPTECDFRCDELAILFAARWMLAPGCRFIPAWLGLSDVMYLRVTETVPDKKYRILINSKQKSVSLNHF